MQKRFKVVSHSQRKFKTASSHVDQQTQRPPRPREKMSLSPLHDLSISIIQTSLSHPLGFIKLPSSTETPFSPKELRLLDLQRELDSISKQIVETRESSGLHEKRTFPHQFPYIRKLGCGTKCRTSNIRGSRYFGKYVIGKNRHCTKRIFQSASRKRQQRSHFPKVLAPSPFLPMNR